MDWQILLTALAICLILEGLFPFIYPRGLKQLMAHMSEWGDALWRKLGLACIVCGLLLLYFIR